VKSLIVPYIRAADDAAVSRAEGRIEQVEGASSQNVLVELYRPEELMKRLRFSLPEGEGGGKDGLLDTIRDVLRYSVNTWDQGFLDKLYSSTNAVSRLSYAKRSPHTELSVAMS
jgi:glutamate decarboxylase